METLPEELQLHILSRLPDRDLATFTAVSRHFGRLARDPELWRARCFDRARGGTAANADRRSSLFQIPDRRQRSAVLDIYEAAHAATAAAPAAAASTAAPQERAPDKRRHGGSSGGGGSNVEAAIAERQRRMANWDPSGPREPLDWRDEYVARAGPLAVSWLQPAARVSATTPHDDDLLANAAEPLGMGLHTDATRDRRVVAPLDDGSVALWTLAGERPGAIAARSRPGLLSADGSGSSPVGGVQPGTVESVSIDSVNNRAYIAAPRGLCEIDLATLQLAACTAYPAPVSALAPWTNGWPLTVGTSAGLHLHDPRQPPRFGLASGGDSPPTVDTFAGFPAARRGLVSPLDVGGSGGGGAATALYSQPGPLSILNFPADTADTADTATGAGAGAAGEIYVAGRFPSLLVYDRRAFPRLRGTLHSGARLCSMAAVPRAFRQPDADRRRRGSLSRAAAAAARDAPGATLVAAGEYNGKGSLELYGLAPDRGRSGDDGGDGHGGSTGGTGGGDGLPTATFKNRVSAGRSKLLAAASHGARLLVADGDGALRWLERDGATPVRRWRISDGDESSRGAFRATTEDEASDDDLEAPPGAQTPRFLPWSASACGGGEVARKLLPVGPGARADVLLWTGERIGALACGEVRARFGGWAAAAAAAREEGLTAAEREARREERRYGEAMRRALQRQALETRRVAGLGLGA